MYNRFYCITCTKRHVLILLNIQIKNKHNSFMIAKYVQIQFQIQFRSQKTLPNIQHLNKLFILFQNQ
jgi:hypothetical protein